MKKIVLLFICSFFGLNICFAQEGVSFKETTHDFGTIPENGGKVSYDFEFTNNHPSPLLVTKVTASCGCTSPFWTTEPIEPGKTGKISVTFNPAGYSASFSKTITVNTNFETGILLKITGKVIRKGAVEKNPANDYPFAFGNYLLKNKDLTFGSLSPGETKAIRLEVFNNSDKSITQKLNKIPEFLSVSFGSESVDAKKTSTVDVTFQASKVGKYGLVSGELELLIDGTTYSFPYTATVVDKFDDWTTDQRADAGKINFSENEINFENLKKGKNKVLKISNSGKSVLHIRDIQPADAWVKIAKPVLNINPGEIVEVGLSIDTKKAKTDFSSHLTVFSDDPQKPITEIKITGNF
jgi:hypothetical protein